jgi:hypothetical protein
MPFTPANTVAVPRFQLPPGPGRFFSAVIEAEQASIDLIGCQIGVKTDFPSCCHSRRMFVAFAALPRRDFVISWAHGQISS